MSDIIAHTLDLIAGIASVPSIVNHRIHDDAYADKNDEENKGAHA